MDFHLRIAAEADLAALLPLVSRYHAFEEIERSPDERQHALLPLLRDSHLGRIWLIQADGELAGYLAICYCYSIEYGGRESFVDEFFIDERHRGQGLGERALNAVAKELTEVGIRAISLEVAHTNAAAQRFYGRSGFVARDRYGLMTRLLTTDS